MFYNVYGPSLIKLLLALVVIVIYQLLNDIPILLHIENKCNFTTYLLPHIVANT